MTSFARPLLVALAVLAPAAAPAQNLITNSEFDAAINGWSAGGNAAVRFDPADANGSTSSGSLALTNVQGSATAATASQCAPIAGGRPFYFGARVRIPSGQLASGSGAVSVTWYAAGGCAGAPALTDTTSGVSAVDAWTAVTGTSSPPAGARSVLFSFTVSKAQAGALLQVLFDDAFLVVSVPATLTVPAAAAIHGNAGAYFHTDLTVMNRSHSNAQTVMARLRCLTYQACNYSPAPIVLSPRQAVTIPDALVTLFGAAEKAGAIEITYETTLGNVFATSKVYTPNLPAPTYGAAVPAYTAADGKTRAVFLGLASNGGDLSDGFRSNVGAYNPLSFPVKVTLQLRDGETGATIGALIERTWAANEAFQINDIFNAVDAAKVVTRNAYLEVTAAAPLFPYVTVIDNRSGDSVWVVPGPDEP